jgi:hypothetical protein
MMGLDLRVVREILAQRVRVLREMLVQLELEFRGLKVMLGLACKGRKVVKEILARRDRDWMVTRAISDRRVLKAIKAGRELVFRVVRDLVFRVQPAREVFRVARVGREVPERLDLSGTLGRRAVKASRAELAVRAIKDF